VSGFVSGVDLAERTVLGRRIDPGGLNTRGSFMDGRIQAELAALSKGEAAFEEVLAAVRGLLHELDRGLSRHLAEWDGDAKAAYRRAHREWRAAADDMADSLDDLKKVIGVAHRNYGRSIRANLAMWHGR
jgi:WXG100 family type VII secretion target